MTIDLRYRKTGLLPGEVPIKRTELNRLRRVQMSHDYYHRSLTILSAGTEAMRDEAARGSEFAKGWLACMRLLMSTIENESGRGGST